MLLRGGGAGRFGTTGLTFGGSGAFGLGPPNRGGDPTPGRFGTTGATGGGAFATGASISISVSSSGSSSTADSEALASSAMVGSNSAGGGISSGETSSLNDGTSGASSSMSPNSALVVSNPSSVPPAVEDSSPSTRLVDSISRDVSGSAVTVSSKLSATPSGSSAGSGSGLGGAEGGGGGGTRPFTGGLPAGGESTSRNTRLDVFRLPDFDGSSGGFAFGGAAVGAAGRRSGAPYIRRCSSSVSRRCAPSAEMSANSFRAAKACWIFPTLCIRSAYSTKFCLASAMKPFEAYSLASLR